jgi:hypothetical protein
MSNLYVDKIYNASGNQEVIIDRIISSNSYNFSGTIQFSVCGQTGAFGPTLSNARSTYTGQAFASTWLNNLDLFNVIAGVQFWKVPKTATYTIRCAGARSGPSTHGGLGIDLTTTFYLYNSEFIKIVCGQRGEGNSGAYGGGGGASFLAVFRYGTWVPVIVSGGGAGVSTNSPQSANTNRNAFNPTVRQNETQGGMGSKYANNYTSDIGYYWAAGGGGGWSSDGVDGGIGISHSTQSIGGRALNSTSPIGGLHLVTPSTTYNGGFGGGGATGVDGGAAGGGGGWWGGNSSYSGVSSVSDDTTHLGGGSYSIDNYTINGTNNGEGFVYITL